MAGRQFPYEELTGDRATQHRATRKTDAKPVAPPPRAYTDPPPISDEEFVVVRRRVALPATILMWLSVAGIVADLALMGAIVVTWLRYDENKTGAIVAILVLPTLFMITHIAIVVGCRQMARLSNQTNAFAVCLAAMIPFFSPLLVLGIPFGLWGLVVLLLPSTRRAVIRQALWDTSGNAHPYGSH